jgi:hypothetical protein
MDRAPFLYLFGPLVLGLIGLVGCNQAMKNQSPWAAHMATNPRKKRLVLPPKGTSRLVAKPYREKVPAPASPEETTTSVVHVNEADVQEASQPDDSSKPETEAKKVTPVEGKKTSHANPSPPPARKEPTLARGADYSWLRGQVGYSRLTQGWYIRYAPFDQVDRYGGSLTLIDDGNLGLLAEGQFVTVRGHVEEPVEFKGTPRYRVFEIDTDVQE